jgi:hypothetical protein
MGQSKFWDHLQQDLGAKFKHYKSKQGNGIYWKMNQEISM